MSDPCQTLHFSTKLPLKGWRHFHINSYRRRENLQGDCVNYTEASSLHLVWLWCCSCSQETSFISDINLSWNKYTNSTYSDSFSFCSTGTPTWLLLSSVLSPAGQQDSVQDLPLLNTLVMVRIIFETYKPIKAIQTKSKPLRPRIVFWVCINVSKDLF